jgi:hypothetical protein
MQLHTGIAGRPGDQHTGRRHAQLGTVQRWAGGRVLSLDATA